MTFNPGSGVVGDERHLFIPDDGGSVQWEVEMVDQGEKLLVCICTLFGEDIGMAHLLRCELLRDPRLTFVACQNPHPQEEIIKIRFHLPAKGSQDHQATARQTLDQAIRRTLAKLEALEHQL